jgi:aspartyl-tRNA(Asn)/glutamyl-tRNA(Gln) amidotransferase subunit A
MTNKAWIELKEKIIKLNEKTNFVVETLSDEQMLKNSQMSPYLIKDNFCTIELCTSGSSNFLKNFKPQYDATVVKLFKEKGYFPIAKTALDEFGLGGTGTYAATGIVKNPLDYNRLAGGSSSGSAVAVASGLVDFSIGTDTGDSVRKPASYCGVYGFKPSYGAISRYGVMPFAPSLDHVAIFANSTKRMAQIMDIVCHFDEKDMTSIKTDFNFEETISKKTFSKEKRICVFNQVINKISDLKVKKAFTNTIESLIAEGYRVDFVDFDLNLLEVLPSLYSIISSVEAFSCYSNLNGVNFGMQSNAENLEQAMTFSRTFGLGEEVKKRFLFGSLVSMQENRSVVLDKAKKVRRLLSNEVQRIFEKYEHIIFPAAESIAPTFEQLKSGIATNFVADILVIANFCGLPSITVPVCKIDDMPWAINITSNYRDDEQCLLLAHELSKVFKYE